MKKHCLLSLLLCLCTLTKAEVINLKTFGGKADGKTSNTAIIKKAIEKLSTEGGGTLFFPAGTYLTGPIVLKSNITLDIEAGATIKFSDDFSEYTPFVEMRYEGVVMKSFCPMIYAYEQQNITIKGEGTIDGNGKKWWYGTFSIEGAHKDEDFRKELAGYQDMWSKENPNFTIEEQSDWKRTLGKRFFRPPLMQPYKCKDFKVEGVTIINSPFWTINPEFCENVTVQGVTINNPDAPNTDGINPSSCKNVLISDCHITVGDDCITLKSGRDLQGREYATPCENITITNCVMLAGHGGVVIGSEMSGDVRKVTISNCVFDGTDRGIRLKSTRGRGGIVEEIRVSNIVMKNIVGEAITLNLFYSNVPAEEFSERTPVFRNIHISGLTGSEVNTACTVLGIEEALISDISFSDINIDAKTGFVINKAKDITLDNVRVNTEIGAAFKISDTENIRINNVYSPKPLAGKPVMEVTDVKDMFIQGCFPEKGSSSFIQLDGQQTDNIILVNNYLNRLSNPIVRAATLNNSANIIEK
ncbi:Polygalacturonase [Dysgonomonas macrotermitis]|uniref:Polygalacturonase n=1 Tax=Dysgonomonas macrotermitis TaxID=1346286 RepID=A0A1M4VYS7_9BACT|nr:Polygalacturonase [Dysgonomonas macrotermitis]